MHEINKLKYVLVGDANVGKTAIAKRLINNRFIETSSTIGVEFSTRIFKINEDEVQLQLWDTAGHEKYRSITNLYYRGSQCVIIVFDLHNRMSFDNISYWLSNSRNCIPNSYYLLIGNKSDLNREVSFEEARKFAEENDMKYVETSAYNGDNIEEAFLRSATDIYNDILNGYRFNDMIKHTSIRLDRPQSRNYCCSYS